MQRIVMAGLLAYLMVPAAGAAEPGIEFFEKKIRPVLVEHCYKCHSAAEKQRGGLVVDTRAGLLKGGDNGPSVVPGKPDESLLIEAVRYQDEFLRMPPKGKLPDAVVADLEKWVAMGAPDPRTGDAATTSSSALDMEKAREFWAYKPITKPAPPEVRDGAWPHNDVDRFILAQLEKKGLRPGPDADRVTLLRRATFALTGLPPTPEQVEAFARDDSPDAYANLVDRLLESPAFGERWGRHWLDVARFAESTGGGRSMLLPDAWRYRDYVIRSFNQDKPYDRFVMEQLAGDLMDAATPDQKADNLIATAFLALGPTNYERQDKDILEMDVIDEQLDTLGRAFMGMTIGCARCHDHKFDPIPTKDYYALAGIFHSTQTMVHSNVSKWVEVTLPMEPELAAEVKKHEAAVAELEEKIKAARAALKKAGRAPAGKRAVALADLPGIVVDDEQATRVGQWKHSTSNPGYIHRGYLHDENTGKGDKTLTFVPKFTRAGRYEVLLAYAHGTSRSSKVPVVVFSADGEKTVYVNMKLEPPVGGNFVSLGVYQFEANDQWYVMVSNEGTDGHVTVDAVQFLPEDGAEARAPGARPAEAKSAADMTEAELKKMEAELKKLQASGPKRPTTMGVRDGKPHDIAVCIRGNFHTQGEKVSRGFLQIATAGTPPAIPPDQSGRLQLAQWLASADNPLTARVMANRVWYHLVGAGIVRTVDNFGATGELPSHPELLDHLASRFIENGWSVKKLIREIMLSHTYRLSSDPHPEARKLDPENRLLARMNRKRLEAEAIRDAILTVSGRLRTDMGGPNVRPGTSSEYGYRFDDDRRSVYTPIFRNQLHDLFEVFDFADPNLVVGRRNVSTVSTQALFLMNSPFVMDHARAAAERTLSWDHLDDAGRIQTAYLLALGRRPTPQEYELVAGYLETPAAQTPEGKLAAWEKVYQVLYACIDFRYVR